MVRLAHFEHARTSLNIFCPLHEQLYAVRSTSPNSKLERQITLCKQAILVYTSDRQCISILKQLQSTLANRISGKYPPLRCLTNNITPELVISRGRSAFRPVSVSQSERTFYTLDEYSVDLASVRCYSPRSQVKVLVHLDCISATSLNMKFSKARPPSDS